MKPPEFFESGPARPQPAAAPQAKSPLALNPQPDSPSLPGAEALNTEEASPALLSFYEKISEASNIREFLLFLQGQIPKKLKTGELMLFYVSPQFGLRRAYLKKNRFYEEIAQKPWPLPSDLREADQNMIFYLTREMGRPFSGALAAPFHKIRQTAFGKSLFPVLFVELRERLSSAGESKSAEFFRRRLFVMRLILERALLSAGSSRTSYLWSQVFGRWSEPAAILRGGRKLRANPAFDRILPFCPGLLDSPPETPAGSSGEEKNSGRLRRASYKKPAGLFESGKNGSGPLLSVRGRIYRRRYYPISPLPGMEGAVFLYCQDMTRHFHLKEELLQSRKMADLARLGRDMSHQLNNPLTGIRSMAQILSQNPDLGALSEDFKEVEKATARAQAIIKSLLVFSKKPQKNSGAKEAERQVFDVNQAVQGALTLLKSMTSGIRAKVRLSPKPLMAEGDFSLFQQAVYNLVLNSCQALKERHASPESPPRENAHRSAAGRADSAARGRQTGSGSESETAGGSESETAGGSESETAGGGESETAGGSESETAGSSKSETAGGGESKAQNKERQTADWLSGGPAIEIATEKKSGSLALIQITDNGPGIPEGHREKIFQPLWTTKKSGEGTGLGLSLSRRAVEQLGGRLSVQSKVNQFSRFTIALPLCPASRGQTA